MVTVDRVIKIVEFFHEQILRRLLLSVAWNFRNDDVLHFEGSSFALALLKQPSIVAGDDVLHIATFCGFRCAQVPIEFLLRTHAEQLDTEQLLVHSPHNIRLRVCPVDLTVKKEEHLVC